MKTECIDRTIEILCEWVWTETAKPGVVQRETMLPDMVKALAELVSARAGTGLPVKIDAKAVSEATRDRLQEVLAFYRSSSANEANELF